MKLLTKNTDYAVRALVTLAGEEGGKSEFVSIRKIAEKQKIPYQYLRNIVQILIKNKLVKSKEGATGGVKLNKRPDKIKMTDLINIFQGDIQLSECMFRKKICHNRKTCPLRKEIKGIEKIVKNEFAKLTIQKLIEVSKKP
ncbi:MAG: Rrf2 family transcriptional regulator [Planctomycetes bacterium]|nr:Rrf2 family transcriptional regulator [Planctomycetota bacterium]